MTSSTICVLLFFASLLFFCIVAIVILMRAQKDEKQISLNMPEISDNTYVLIYASQSGQTEAYAKKTAEQLQSVGESVVLININQLTIKNLQDAYRVIWMVSTYGDGDSPDTAQKIIHLLYSQNLNLSHQTFAILAFGDRRYVQFCAFGQSIYTWLLEQNAKPWFDLITVDRYSCDDLSDWNAQIKKVTSHSLEIALSEKKWETVTLSSRTLLNAGSMGTGLYQLNFSVPQYLTWRSGDILEVRCHNCDDALQEFQKEYPQIETEVLPRLRYKNLKNPPVYSFDQSIIDWFAHFSNLPIREYSIASIPQQGYLELVVRQEVLDNGLGLGSGLLTKYLNLDDTLQINIRSNSSFHLQNNRKPIILIGNGSGIAGLLAHLHHQEQCSVDQNWLIYGERQEQFDSIYHNQLLKWQGNGTLSDVDLVFSRDGKSIRYVQDKIFEKQEQLKVWLDKGASIYVCGSLKGMATDVENALDTILGHDYILNLKSQKRYQRDVY